jgi:hypothetical protein
METIVSLAAVNMAEHHTDHGRINKAVFILWQFFVGSIEASAIFRSRKNSLFQPAPG